MRDVAEIAYTMRETAILKIISVQMKILQVMTLLQKIKIVVKNGIQFIKEHTRETIGCLIGIIGVFLFAYVNGYYFALIGAGVMIILSGKEEKMKEYTLIYKAEVTEVLTEDEFENVPMDESGKPDLRKLAEVIKDALDVDDVNVIKAKVFEMELEN